MDLLVEKDGNRTCLSRYKVITTSFEESSPSIKRNNTKIQYRNGNVDFGGWHEAKTIDYVGYYRADDLEDEEYLREKIYALLSDPEGYYVTQLKNENEDEFERPGETSGDYFDKQVNRPSHKRFYVYASSLESELVGSYSSHVLYKISATFATMKLPYGESVPRNLDVKPDVAYYSENLALGTSTPVVVIGENKANQAFISYAMENVIPVNTKLIVNCDVDSTDGTGTFIFQPYGSDSGSSWQQWATGNLKKGSQHVTAAFVSKGNIAHFYPRFDKATGTITISNFIISTVPSPWNPNQSDSEYNAWYTKIYYNTKNLVIPYAGTVPCNQLEQGFTIEFTAKEAGSRLVVDVNGTELTYNGQVYSGDVVKLSGYEYTKNDISIVKYTNKAYFKLIPGITNTISSNLHGSIRILDYQDLYA